MVTTTDELAGMQKQNPVPLKGFDYIELYVGNARQAAHYYRTAFGFSPIAYAGLETGIRDRTSFVLQQNDIRLVLTAPLTPDGPIAEHVKLHGDDVRDIAFTVDNAEESFALAVEHGATPILEPTVYTDQNGSMVKATIGAFGDTVHSFIQRDGFYGGTFFPEFHVIQNPPPAVSTGLVGIDHVAIGVEAAQLDELVNFYNAVLGFHHSYTEGILTEYSSMNSKVVENKTGNIKFPIVEPAPGKRRSQIEEYLSFHRGPGAQHVALSSDNILETVRALRANGNEFLQTPDTYYSMLKDRIGELEEDVEELRELSILVDRDEWGYLMQIFTKPLLNRPTTFMEIIQRKRARGFGGGNIKALFEAIERDQLKRGNL
jgi:4-hydroxyphenylpyruvate dioxygenase